MKLWNGLLRKEWSLMREWLYATAIMSSIIIVAVVLEFTELPGNVFNFFPVAGIVIILFMIISLFLPVALLVNSLKIELKRSDVWLHSTSSAYELFGAKAVFAAGVGAVNMFAPTIVFVLCIRFFGSPLAEFTTIDLIIFTVNFVSSFYIASIMLLCVGLFLVVFNQLIKPFVKGFARLVTLFFFGLMAWTFERVKEMAFYQSIVSFGPIGDTSKEPFYIEREGFFIGPSEPVIYAGDIGVSLLLIVFLFVMSSLLFEKKVRL